MVLHVQPIISLISVVNLVNERHAPITRHREPQDQLLEIGTVVLVDAIRHDFRRMPSLVSATERYGSRILVRARAIESEDFDAPEGQVKKYILVPAVVKRLQSAAHAVVMDHRRLPWVEPKMSYVQRSQPVRNLVHRHRRREDVVDQHR
jgi:hypothetical protein